MLERRAAATVRASRAARRRADAAVADEHRRTFVIRSRMMSESVWPSELCSIVERRADRTVGTVQELVRRSMSANRSGESHERQRCHWARIVRGLERRIARAAEQESSWPD